MGEDSFGEAFCHGFVDRDGCGLLRVENLYRRGRMQRFAWRLGWEVANALTSRPLRNAKKTARGSCVKCGSYFAGPTCCTSGDGLCAQQKGTDDGR